MRGNTAQPGAHPKYSPGAALDAHAVSQSMHTPPPSRVTALLTDTIKSPYLVLLLLP